MKSVPSVPIRRRALLHHAALARSPRPARRGLPPRGASRAGTAHGVAALLAKQALRDAALRDCGRRCAYCATVLTRDSATLDHVYPRAHGGTNAPGNVVSACGRCNRMKGDLLPHEFFLRHPWAGLNFMRHARCVHRALKRYARRAVSLAYAEGWSEDECGQRVAA